MCFISCGYAECDLKTHDTILAPIEIARFSAWQASRLRNALRNFLFRFDRCRCSVAVARNGRQPERRLNGPQHERKGHRCQRRRPQGARLTVASSKEGRLPFAFIFSQGNHAFLKKIPPGAEASNVLVGEVDCLDKPVSAFIRLSTPVVLGDLTEVPVPTRFIFILLGPVVSPCWPRSKCTFLLNGAACGCRGNSRHRRGLVEIPSGSIRSDAASGWKAGKRKKYSPEQGSIKMPRCFVK